MKNKKLISGIVALSAVALLGGGLLAANAATFSSAPTKIGQANGWFHHRDHGHVNLTADQKVAIENKREANQAAMQARQTAVAAAITNNNYNAWVTAVGSGNPLVQKITSANFPQYVQAYNLMQQSRQIMTSLGLDHGFGGHDFHFEHAIEE